MTPSSPLSPDRPRYSADPAAPRYPMAVKTFKTSRSRNAGSRSRTRSRTSAATALLASATALEMVSPGVVSIGAASSGASALAEVASPRVRLRNSMNSSN